MHSEEEVSASFVLVIKTVTTKDGGFNNSCELTVITPVSAAPVPGTTNRVYPNPLTEDILNITSKYDIERIRIFDLSGTLMHEVQNLK